MARKFIKPKQFFEQLSLGLVFEDAKPDLAEAIPRISHHYVGWDRPVLDSAVEFLVGDWDGTGALDLSGDLVLAPTRHAGRRLREALAIAAAEYDAAVLPPLVVTTNFLTDPARLEDLKAPAPDRAMTLAIWASAMLDLDLARFRNVFPIDPVDRNLSWAMNLANDLLQVRDLLCREGLSFATASKRLGPEEMEANRWRELARIEKQVVARTKQLGYTDVVEANHKAAKTVNLPPEVNHIVILACPDLPGMACRTLQDYSRKFPVDIVIAAPEERKSWFDDWGNPLPEIWNDAEIDLPNPGETIQSAANPSEQADAVCELISGHSNPALTTAIGVPDPETIAPIEQALAARHWSTHDPSGKPLKQNSTYYLLEQTHRLIESGSFDAFRQLLRIPDWLAAMMRSVDLSTDKLVSRTGFVRMMDKLALETLPDNLGDAKAAASRKFRNHIELEHGIIWIQNWIKRFNQDDFGDTLIQYLVDIFEKKSFSDDEEDPFPEVAGHIMQCIDVLRDTEKVFNKPLNAASQFELLLELIKDRRLYPDRSAKNIDLEGWIELLWEDAPHLVVTGMNDSCVPESITSHAYLPNGARKFLGIADNDSRFARDAYLLSLMVESRRNNGGRVDFVFGRQSVSGDPLRPSRLLFQCPDDELPSRTLQFFSGESKDKQLLPWHLAWKLKPEKLPEDAKVFQRLSVTAFKAYLTCPFRFYLKFGLEMEDVELDKSEMNAMEFGNLVHDTLEAFGKDEEASQYTNPDKIRDFFYDQIDRILNYTFGKQWTTPVVIQREAARQRLSWWADIEAEQRKAGWQILDPESQIGSDEEPYMIDGMWIRGRIDRIEKHNQFGYRVFDFKTMSPKDKQVVEFHVTPIKRSEDIDSFPEWCRVTNDSGKLSRWIDLQLPLYRLALEERFPGEKISVGYVTLGRTRKEVAISMWEDIDDRYLESAKDCVSGIIESVRNQRFWPPTERLPYRDNFEELFFGDPLTSVDPSCFTDS